MPTDFMEANVEEFLTRFFHCHDGVIQHINLDLAGGASNYRAIVVVSVQDATLSIENRWVDLKLVFDQVNEYIIRHNNVGFIQVISFGVSIFFGSNLLYFVFDGSEIETVEDVRFQQSEFYFRAKSASWEIVG